MPHVIWNLSYPIITSDQFATFRLHFEALRQDSHVAEVTATERADTPHVMTMRVTFADGFDRPDSQELRFADALYPSQMRHFERDIQMLTPSDSTPDQAREALRQLQFELPRISGLSAAEVVSRMRDVVQALRIPDMHGLLQALGPPIEGFTPPTRIPAWITVGRAYRLKGEGVVVTLKNVRVTPGGISVESQMDGGKTRVDTLGEFVGLFEPYDRPTLPRTAWSRVLDDDSED